MSLRKPVRPFVHLPVALVVSCGTFHRDYESSDHSADQRQHNPTQDHSPYGVHGLRNRPQVVNALVFAPIGE